MRHMHVVPTVFLNSFSVVLVTLLVSCLGAVPPAAAAADACAVVGNKATKEYLLARERACFANKKKAEKKGYVPFSLPALGFTALLNGENEVPAVVTSATGSCTAALNAARTSLQIHCTHDVSSPTGAHIHEGAAGAEGGIICDLGNGSSPLVATCAMTAELVTALISDALNVNIHSTGNGGGEIRGQLQ